MPGNRVNGLLQHLRRRFRREAALVGDKGTVVTAMTAAAGDSLSGGLPIIMVGKDDSSQLDDQLSCSLSAFTISDTTTIRTSFSSKRSLGYHKSSSHHRRVRFAKSRNGDGGVLTDVRVIVSHPEERRLPQKNADRTCHFVTFQEDALKAIEEENCRTLLNSLDKMYFGMVCSKDPEAEAKRMQGMAQWSKVNSGKYRGLEATLMKRAHKRRIGHRRHVLEKQATIRREGPYLNTGREEQLRRASHKYTKAAEEFSMLLALGDSMALNGHALNDLAQEEEHEVLPATEIGIRAEL